MTAIGGTALTVILAFLAVWQDITPRAIMRAIRG
jgi:hypothetical protein